MFVHAHPGIVDGARKTSQVGGWVRSGALGRGCRFSSSPMLEGTSSRNQYMNVATSVVHHVEICTLVKLVNRLRLMHWCTGVGLLGAHPGPRNHTVAFLTLCGLRRSGKEYLVVSGAHSASGAQERNSASGAQEIVPPALRKGSKNLK